ncbi:MAG: helix-turn-helix transcriptional regulator [Clostridiales bacterium]|nr:helix-turn-helix transcriptional regulator [Candidatus Blautia equi]
MQKNRPIHDYEEYKEKKSHGERNFPFSIYTCSIPRDFPEVLMHWHEETEIIFIKEGKGIVSVDLEMRVLSAPALAFVLPGQLHSIGQYEGESMEYVNYIFHPRLLQSHNDAVFDQQYLTPLFDGTIEIPVFLQEHSPGFSSLSDSLLGCEETDSPLMVKSCLFQLCSRMRELFPERTGNTVRRESMERIKTLLLYIQDHYKENITVTDAAAQIDLSENHFMRFFKQTLGVSFVTYLRNYRLTKAEEMLYSTDASILDIAQDSGFQNVSYFIREFRNKYGETPLKYRRQKSAPCTFR